MPADMYTVLSASFILIVLLLWYCFVTRLLRGYWPTSSFTSAKTSTPKQQHDCGHVMVVVNDDIVVDDSLDSTNTSTHNVLISENELLHFML